LRLRGEKKINRKGAEIAKKDTKKNLRVLCVFAVRKNIATRITVTVVTILFLKRFIIHIALNGATLIVQCDIPR